MFGKMGVKGNFFSVGSESIEKFRIVCQRVLVRCPFSEQISAEKLSFEKRRELMRSMS